MDIKEINADVGVIITKTMPNKIDCDFAILEGIYVCTFSGFKSISKT